MPILKRANACIHYEDSGTGEPLLLLHGFSVSSRYWSETGVTAELAGHYRGEHSHFVGFLSGHGS